MFQNLEGYCMSQASERAELSIHGYNSSTGQEGGKGREVQPIGKELRLVCDQILSCWTSHKRRHGIWGRSWTTPYFMGGETNWCKAEARSGKEGECIEQRYA